MSSEQVSNPQMTKLYFMSDGREPVKLWEECKKAREDWERWAKENKVEDEQLQDAIKTLVINFVFHVKQAWRHYLEEQMKTRWRNYWAKSMILIWSIAPREQICSWQMQWEGVSCYNILQLLSFWAKNNVIKWPYLTSQRSLSSMHTQSWCEAWRRKKENRWTLVAIGKSQFMPVNTSIHLMNCPCKHDWDSERV